MYQSSPRSTEIDSSLVTKNHEMNPLGIKETTNEDISPSSSDINQALRRIEQQLSLNDDEEKEKNIFHFVSEDSNDLEYVLCDHHGLSAKTSSGPDDFLSSESGIYPLLTFELSSQIVLYFNELTVSQEAARNANGRSIAFSVDGVWQQHQLTGVEDDIWTEILASSINVPNVESGSQDDRNIPF